MTHNDTLVRIENLLVNSTHGREHLHVARCAMWVVVVSQLGHYDDSDCEALLVVMMAAQQLSGLARGPACLKISAVTKSREIQLHKSFLYIFLMVNLQKSGVDCQHTAGKGVQNLPKVTISRSGSPTGRVLF